MVRAAIKETRSKSSRASRHERRSWVYALGVADDLGSPGARIRFAIANRRLIEVRFSGSIRVAEPHDYGIQKARERLLVFQLRGPVRPRHTPIGWRLLEIANIEALTVLDDIESRRCCLRCEVDRKALECHEYSTDGPGCAESGEGSLLLERRLRSMAGVRP